MRDIEKSAAGVLDGPGVAVGALEGPGVTGEASGNY